MKITIDKYYRLIVDTKIKSTDTEYEFLVVELLSVLTNGEIYIGRDFIHFVNKDNKYKSYLMLNGDSTGTGEILIEGIHIKMIKRVIKPTSKSYKRMKYESL